MNPSEGLPIPYGAGGGSTSGIAARLSSAHCCITAARLGRNLEGAEAIARMLPLATALTTLGLSYADVGAEGAATIVAAVPRAKSLTQLDGVPLNEYLKELGLPRTHHLSSNQAILSLLRAPGEARRLSRITDGQTTTPSAELRQRLANEAGAASPATCAEEGAA